MSPRKPKAAHRKGWQEGHHASPGEGAIYPVKGGMRWRGQFTWHAPDGASKLVWITGIDEADVRRRWAARKAELEQAPDRLGAETTLRDLLLAWLRNVVQPRQRQTTFELYARYCERLTDLLGDLRVVDLTKADLERFYAEMKRARHWSPKTASTAHGVFGGALSYARDQGIVRTLATDGVTLARVPYKEHVLLTPAQIGAVLRTADERGDPLAALWYVAVQTGLRRGELIALRWQDVDLGTGLLTVRGQIVRVEEGLIRTEPKSARGLRPVRLGPAVLEQLQRHRVAQRPQRELVFPRQDGRPYDGRLIDYHWGRLLQHAGVPHAPLHALRHGVGSHMIAAGVPVNAVQAWLGHASASTTLNVYAPVLAGWDEAAMRVITTVYGLEWSPVAAPVTAQDADAPAC